RFGRSPVPLGTSGRLAQQQQGAIFRSRRTHFSAYLEQPAVEIRYPVCIRNRQCEDRMVSRHKLICGGAALAVAAAVAWGTAAPPAKAKDDIGVFAAASLYDALDAINAAWQKESGKKATISYAASSALAKRIEEDAPAQIFISADVDWMDYVEQKKLI